MNIRLSEKGSLLTAVAMLCSISMTWKRWALEMVVKSSKMSEEVNARGTLIFN